MAAMDDLRVLIAAATPGPWQMDDESTVCANNEVIAVPCGVFGRDQQDADMALIVAAVNALPGLLDRLAAVEKQCEELRRVVIQGVTANPGVLHHYKCLACGGRWSGRPPVAEQHIGECAAIAARKGEG